MVFEPRFERLGICKSDDLFYVEQAVSLAGRSTQKVFDISENDFAEGNVRTTGMTCFPALQPF